MNPMKYRVSPECSKIIRNILKVDPLKRPSVKQILESEYVLQMSRKFKWDLKKLLKFRKMKRNSLSSSAISGVSQYTNTSYSDSFFFDKKMSGFTTLIDAKDLTSEQNQIISNLGNKGNAINKSGKNVVRNEGLVLNFEKKTPQKEVNIFLKEVPRQESGKSNAEQFTVKDSSHFDSPSKKMLNEADILKLNVFSQKNSENNCSQLGSRNASQIKSTSFAGETNLEVSRKDSNEEINKNLDEMVTMFGLEDDENIGLLKKVSQVMSSNMNVSKKNVSQMGEDRKGVSENNASFFKGGCLTPLGGNSRSEGLFLKDLSKIELVKSGTDNLISTERGLPEKELEILKGTRGVTQRTTETGDRSRRPLSRRPISNRN